jgi:tyrosine-protein phosphatase YwqE
MLSLFKSKYYLKDLLPENYVDIHNHLLPGIDDGAKSVEQTSLLFAEMQALNISNAIATPHTFVKYWNNTSTTIKDAFEIATKTLENKSFFKRLCKRVILYETLINRIQQESLLCIQENYLLLEFPLFNNPIDLYEMLFELKIKNYKIILAHPERYMYLHNSLKKFEKLKDFGLLFQLNILSTTGYYGKLVFDCL